MLPEEIGGSDLGGDFSKSLTGLGARQAGGTEWIEKF